MEYGPAKSNVTPATTAVAKFDAPAQNATKASSANAVVFPSLLGCRSAFLSFPVGNVATRAPNATDTPRPIAAKVMTAIDIDSIVMPRRRRTGVTSGQSVKATPTAILAQRLQSAAVKP